MFKSKNTILNQTSFAKFWFSRILSSSSFQMLSVAIGWQMYSITQDAFSLGFVGLAQFLPMFMLTLIVGHIADRFDRRKIVFICQFMESGIAMLLLFGNIGGWLDREHILIAAVILGTCRAFEGPTSASLLPQLVPRENLQQAISWSTSAGQTAQIIGPSIGGLLFSFGTSYVYITAIISFLIAGFLIFFIRLEFRQPNTTQLNTFRSIFSGLVFIYKKRIIFGTLSLDLFAVLLGGATALLPIFAQDILQTGPWSLGLMRTAPAVGALLMSIVLAYVPLRETVGYKLFGALAIFGLATMIFSLSSNLWISLAALFIIGASDVVSVVIRSSLVQLQTPDEMRGRVNAINSLFIGTSNQLGEFRAGIMAGFIGAVPAVFIGGLGTIAVAGLWMYWFPSLRRLKSLQE
ncbi:MFS transporter [Bacillus sp. Marseille-P3661]|uniref:MFS transporter n=1 Tax=Bacillus sp. Marseille-P3661 TaxID=1936234 RepID=UPI000C82C3AF|nr:MFS transporter [Bacillus sp. Marseille-P3661]